MFESLLIFVLTISLVYCACPNKCSGHGTCGAFDKCTCDQFFTLGDCSGRLCPYSKAWLDTPSDLTTAHTYAECGNRGQCDRTTGECICDPGYSGSGCRRTACPNNCNGHGICQHIEEFETTFSYDNWDTEKITGCVCDPGYEGHGCEEKTCPKGDDPLTTDDYDMRQYLDFVSDGGTFTSADTFYLSFKDLYGQNFTTARIEVGASETVLCSNIQSALRQLPSRIFENVDVNIGAGTYFVATRSASPYGSETLTATEATALTAPAARRVCIVVFKTNAGSTGLQNLFVVHTRATAQGHQPYVAGASSISTVNIGEEFVSTSTTSRQLTEQAVCSGRGVCDTTTGICQCFLGHKGIACEKQEALV